MTTAQWRQRIQEARLYRKVFEAAWLANLRKLRRG